MEMEEFRAVVKHFYLKKWTVAQIKVELGEVHGDTETTLKTIYFLINEFTRDRKSTKDEARPGRPVTATAPEMIETIHRIVMEDHREMLCKTSKPFAQKTANGTSEIAAQKNPFSSRQRRSLNGKSAWIRVQTFASSTLLSRFGSQTSWSGSGERDFRQMYFKRFETSYFSEGIKKLEERWTKCVEVKGDYVEK